MDQRIGLRIDAIGNFSNVIGEVNKLQSRLQSLKLPSNLNTKFESSIKNIIDKYNEFQTLANKGVKTKGDFSKLNSSAKEVESSIRALKKELNGVSEQKLMVQVSNLPEVKALEQEIQRLKKTYSELNNLGTKKIQGVFGEEEVNKIRKLVGESKNLKPALENAFKAIQTGNIEEGLKELNEFENALKKINGAALKNFQKDNPNRKSQIGEYIKNAREELNLMNSGVSEAKAKLDQLKTDKFSEMTRGISTAKAQLDNLSDSASRSTKEILNTARATQNMESQLSGLQTQANYFFGLQNMIQLFRRGLSDTIQTVKDLDKAMTDTAVVTDMSVSDLWAQLPDYTKLANKLGATTQGAYETMTLYYQQGLNKEETFEIGEETMKMARIAGLDYAQTTNMMTAALRGFNMELNQTSAKRVNDVYSELAAITASDTRELGLAMERTASIAHSANMDFGNTTAFLAQMIETTREAPENLGTAMKTIIARFQELKANPYEISEVEGEEVDFNRVDKALKSIGVDLMDNRDKFRDLDDVFLDISSKWDGLSQTQQRYIATIAAGARQQSRFLAMVQNYDRLKELTDAAANSEGASDIQFSKTLDSMEAKLNKLHNAWDQFMMGITNNELIKSATGFAVKVLDAINKIETGIEHAGDKIGGIFGDIFKSVTSFTGLLLGFKGIGKLTDIGIGALGGLLGMGRGTGASMFGGMSGIRQSTNMAQAKAISSPIVAAINKLTAVMTKGKVGGPQENYSRGVGREELKNRRKQLRNLVVDETDDTLAGKIKTPKSFNIDQFTGAFKDLNKEEQAALYRGQKGTREAIQRNFEESVKNLKVSDSAQKAASTFYTDLDYAMANGSENVEAGLSKAFNLVEASRVIGGPAGEELHKAALEQRKQLIREMASQKDAKGNPLRGKELEKAWRAKEAGLYGQNIKLNNDEVGKLTSRMNGLTSAANNTGAAFMQIGMTMQSIGFEKLGGVVSVVGSSLLSVGMMAETASHGLKVLKTEAAGAYSVLVGAAPALAIAGGVLAAAFVAFKINQNRIKEIRKSGKEVVDVYEETTKSIQENLNKIDKIQPDWDKWAAGVDANGHNVSLGSEEFQDYKNAVKDLTKAHPELIKGYNAEGEILVDNNTVLKEAINLEKQRQKEATKNYIANGQKIVDKRNTTKRWQKSQDNQIDPTIASHGLSANAYGAGGSQIQKDAEEAVRAIQKIDGGEEVLKRWGVTFDNLGNITEQGINAIRDHGGDIQNALVDAFSGTEITDAQQTLLNNSNDAIAQLGKDFKGVEDASKETFDALKVYATDQGAFQNLDEELIAPYQQNLKRIAEKDISWGDMQKEVNALSAEYQNLGGHLSEYQDVQEKVREAQEKFGKNLDINEYQQKVNEAIENAGMDEWITTLRSSSDQADQILADWFENQKERFLDLSQSLPTLEDGFNTLTSEIASANNAYDNWTKKNEGGDYYTASDGFKKMFDEVNDGVDNLGNKSQSWWSAAEAMMGEDYVWNHSEKTVAAHMKTIGTYFEEGKKGVDNFISDVSYKFQDNKLQDGSNELVSKYIDLTDKGLEFKLDDVSDEKFKAIADAIGLSTDAFTALLNKARQFYDIDFSNVEDMRAAIAGGGTAMIGTSTDTNGQQNLYMRESEFRSQIRAANPNASKKELKDAENELKNNGTILLKDLKDITQKQLSGYFKDWGIADTNGKTDAYSFISSLNKLQYNKDEIQEAFKNNNGLISDYNKADFEGLYNQIKTNEDPTAGSVFSIQGTTEGILSAVNGIALSMGILTKGASDEIDAGVKKAEDYTKKETDVADYNNYGEYKKKQEEMYSSLSAAEEQLVAARDKHDPGTQKYKDLDEKITTIDDSLKAVEKYQLSREEFLQKRKEVANTVATDSGKEVTKAYNNTAVNEKNQLDTDKFESLITSVQANIKDKNDQNNVIGQYLQNNAKILNDQGASNKQISASIQSAVQKMADHGMKPQEIAAAINQGYGTTLTSKDVTTTAEGKTTVNLDQQNLQEQLSNLQADVTANLVGINIKSNATGQNNPNSAFRRTGTMARGSRKGYTISGRPTLMGEEGEEVVWEPKRNEAYIVGSNGPQFGNISKDAVVWNAEQTKRIKKNSKSSTNLGTGARGITPIGTMKGGNAGGGGLKIPGLLNVDATANIQDVVQPADKPEIPVKAKLEVEGAEKGGIVNKIKGLFGKGESGPKIKVTAEATKVNIKEQAEAVKLTGDIVKLNNKADNVKGVEATATVIKVTKSGQVTGEPVKVKATAVVSGKASGSVSTTTIKTKSDNTAQQNINNIKRSGTVLVKTKADNAAQKAINNIKGKDVTIHIKPSFEGTWTKNATVKVNHAAQGQNNYIAHRTAPSFGSAARGRGGKLGPTGKGGLTLTGEKGFEIAWLPSENRSMILGAQGPQMLELPNDAVVWNHKQSKDILKKKQTISAGSMGNSVGGIVPVPKPSSSNNNNKSSSKTVKKAATSTAKHVKNNSDKVAKAATDTAKSIGYVSVWWENIARKTEKSQRLMDDNAKAFGKYIKEMRATLHKTGESLKSGGGGGDDYIKSITKYIGYNQAQVNKATAELKQLDKGTAAQQKGKKGANKAAYNSGAASAVQISYSYKTGKKKKKSKTKNEIVNTAGYIVEQDGTYVINQAALNKVKNVERRKALADALNKEINDRLSKKYSAEDNVKKAKEALEQMGEELYKTFFAWENELTKIWNLTKKITATENNISRAKEYQETLDKQIATGLVKSNNNNYLNQVMDTFILGLTESTDKLRTQIELVNEQKDALRKILSIEDERTTLASITSKLESREALDEVSNEAATTLNNARSNLSSAQSRKTTAQNKINSLKKQKGKAKKQSKKNSIQAQINKEQKNLAKANSDIKKYQKQVSDATAAYNTAVMNAAANLSDTEKLGYEEYQKTLQDTIETQTAAQKYLTVTRNADGTVRVEFDTTSFENDKFEGLLNENRAKAIQDYVKEIVDSTSELSDAYKNANTSVNELYDELSQLQSDWAGYADELWDISENEIKRETESFKQLSSSITDALKRLLEDVKRKLDERRQQEDNANTERDIAQKQQRLAALRADTSGGHQTEIAQLEQEIAKAQQDYQRSLENQLLDKLQTQADLAAEQRERQIEIQETIAEGVNNASLVNLWMSDPTTYRNEIYEAYKAANEYDKKPDALREQIDLKFKELMTGLTTNQDKQAAVVNEIGQIQSIIEKIAKSLSLLTTNISNAKANGLSVVEARDLLGASYEDLRNKGNYDVSDFANSEIPYVDVRQAFSAEELKDNNVYGPEASKEIEEATKAAEQKQIEEEANKKVETGSTETKTKTNTNVNTAADKQKKYNAYMNQLKAVKKIKPKNIKSSHINTLFSLGAAAGYGKASVLKHLLNKTGGSDPFTWENIFKAIIGASGIDRYNLVKTFGSNGSLPKALKTLGNPDTVSEIKKSKKYKSAKALKFATGGLANYTGPAWLDGTPSKPELVLSATDTKNFLALKDVLSSAMNSTNSIDNSYDGDTNIEVNINVDHLNNDYDVDKVANRVKQIIVKDAGYRNVTQVRNLR